MIPKVGRLYLDKEYDGIQETIFRITGITECNNYYCIETESLRGINITKIEIIKLHVDETWLRYYEEIPMEVMIAKEL